MVGMKFPLLYKICLKGISPVVIHLATIWKKKQIMLEYLPLTLHRLLVDLILVELFRVYCKNPKWPYFLGMVHLHMEWAKFGIY